MENIGLLRDLLVVFGCAAPVVYLFHRMKQSPIVGFIMSGALVGPYGFSWIQDVASVHTLATLGVMILLFSLGLEFSLKKLMKTRVAVLVTGPIQMAGTTMLVVLVARYLGFSIGAGVAYGAIIAITSTAVLMRILAERGEVDSVHGRVCLGISIFQDLCAVPVMIAIPLLASGESMFHAILAVTVKAGAIIAAVVLVARYIFPLLLSSILRTRSKELFLITSVFMFLGTAWVTSSAGISLALGSFLAGLILSESEYGQQIFADVRPFRDSLNCVFFISVGMLVEPAFIIRNAGTIAVVTFAIVTGKALIAGGAVMASGIAPKVGILSGVAMAQIGEFSFILLQTAADAGLVSSDPYQVILAAAIVTMVLSPALFGIARILIGLHARRLAPPADAQIEVSAADAGPVRDHVVICGYGVGGRNIASVLKANHIPYLILDLNAQVVREAREEGEPIAFGDCTSSHIQGMAGIRKARVIVIVISDPFAARIAVRVAREMNRDLVILTRTKYVADIDELWNLGSTEVIAEEFEASLELMTRILRVYNAPRAMVAAEIKSIRNQRFGIFRERPTTVPRIRLSSDLDVYTETWEVPRDCPWSGASVAETRLRSESGTLILGIIRNNQTLNNPGPDEKVLSGDRMVLSGTKEQLRRAVKRLMSCEIHGGSGAKTV